MILKTCRKNNFVEKNSSSVGGFSLYRQSDLLNRQHYTYKQWKNRLSYEAPRTPRTWGPIFRWTARYMQWHAITLLNQLSMVFVSFKTSVDGDKKEISKEIGFQIFNLKKRSEFKNFKRFKNCVWRFFGDGWGCFAVFLGCLWVLRGNRIRRDNAFKR